ncbi:hypothetical protein E0H89_03585 [Acinetobacter sp. ANC 3781]|uniref:hypothetical protein n=1 Tax=Acinetobacter sp. ANC 3781 TaxID=2529835 RepID=UPI00103A6DFE|nr:hypothetical protein [Acinetobacter sp. ANC 3781]TCB79346.1 hypothetical protein E0H89_03585 [Acinetobacter sp. ANC 3781]
MERVETIKKGVQFLEYQAQHAKSNESLRSYLIDYLEMVDCYDFEFESKDEFNKLIDRIMSEFKKGVST